MKHEPIPIIWKCPWCGARMELPALWVHLRADHGYDRNRHQQQADADTQARHRVTVDMELGPYRWIHEE